MTRIAILTAAVGLALTPTLAEAWEMKGVKTLALHTRDEATIPIGTIDFQPQGDKKAEETTFKIDLDKKRFTVFFLSMRNFDCVEGDDVECHVPYPYDNPRTASATDLNWLADNLLFLYKTRAEHAATMTNGIRFDLKLTAHGISGTPQAVNLDDIASPPKDPAAGRGAPRLDADTICGETSPLPRHALPPRSSCRASVRRVSPWPPRRSPACSAARRGRWPTASRPSRRAS